MKKTIILLMLSLFGYASQAQEKRVANMIGVSKDEVVSRIDKPEILRTNDGVQYVQQDDKENEFVVSYYFNANNICNWYNIGYPYTKLKSIVKLLNDTNTRIKENVWESYTQNHTLRIQLDKNDTQFFSIDVFVKK